MILRFLHIVMVGLLFISTTGFMVSKHFCQGNLKSISVLFEATPCHQNKAMKHCPMHAAGTKEPKKEDNGCCDTENEFIKAENDQIDTLVSIHWVDHPVLLTALSVVSSLETTDVDYKTRQFFNYKPPLLVYDLSVSLQTFLC